MQRWVPSTRPRITATRPHPRPHPWLHVPGRPARTLDPRHDERMTSAPATQGPSRFDEVAGVWRVEPGVCRAGRPGVVHRGQAQRWLPSGVVRPGGTGRAARRRRAPPPRDRGQRHVPERDARRPGPAPGRGAAARTQLQRAAEPAADRGRPASRRGHHHLRTPALGRSAVPRRRRPDGAAAARPVRATAGGRGLTSRFR